MVVGGDGVCGFGLYDIVVGQLRTGPIRLCGIGRGLVSWGGNILFCCFRSEANINNTVVEPTMPIDVHSSDGAL